MEKQPVSAQRDQTIAELKTLRAWYYYLLMDFFGGVPLVTTTEVQQNPRVTRDSLFKFIETELKDSRDKLPASWPTSQYGRVTKGVANAILASLYVNAQVYTGTVTAAGLTKGTARWQDALDAANAVINSGQYALATDWKSAFRGDNSTNADAVKENIFVVNYTNVAGLGMNFPMRTLHYNQLTTGGGGPWNGFAATAEAYNAFDPADKRRDSTFLVGLQKSFDTGLPIKDRNNAPLDYKVDIVNENQATEAEGPRYNKFPPLSGAPNGDAHPNDYPFFRIAEMYLIKAEAQNELGQTAAGLATLNLVRARSFTPPKPSTAATQPLLRDAIFSERLFEFAGEGKRRRDMIRQGTFLAGRRFKPAPSAPYKVLFPIPATQMQANALLVQNPGY
jgi:hypothetical protein